MNSEVLNVQKKSIKIDFDDGYLVNNYKDPRKTPVMQFYGYVAIIAFSCFLTSSFASAYLYIAPAIEHEFGISEIQARLPFTVYVLAWGVGPLFFSPLGDIFGRRTIFLFSQLMWIIFHVGSARSQSISALIATRFFAGLLGSASLTCGAQVSTDVAEGLTVVKAVAIYCTVVFLGPVVGPIIGSAIAQYVSPLNDTNGGWRWLFYAAIISGTLVLLVMLFVLPETNAAIILQRKAKKLEEMGIDIEKNTLQNTIILPKIALILNDVSLMLIKEPIIIFISLWQTTVMGILYLFFEAFPVVYGYGYRFSIFQTGLSFIGIGVGMILCCLYSITVDMKIYVKMVIANKGIRVPEMRTGTATLSACMMAISLFWFGYTTYTTIHWSVSIIASVFYGMAAMGVMLSTLFYIVDVYATRSGAAYAATGLIRSIATSFFPLFGASMFRKLGPQKACLILACIAIVEIAIPITARYLGKSIRQSSFLAQTK